MDLSTMKQIFVGAVITFLTVLGVKVSDVKLIEYRLTQVEKKIDSFDSKLDNIIGSKGK